MVNYQPFCLLQKLAHVKCAAYSTLCYSILVKVCKTLWDFKPHRLYVMLKAIIMFYYD